MYILNFILKIYRALPVFKGKLTLGIFLFKKLIHHNKPIEFTSHHQIKYKVPNTQEIIGIELLINGIYEPDVVSFLKKKINDADIFFDVGANIGSIGLPIIKSKKSISYYGFEASPLVFEYLKYNFNNNGVMDFELHNNLVHSANGQDVKFYESDELYGKSSSAPTYCKTHMLVNSIALDSFCEGKKINKINFIKVDVQGFELKVFEGMRQLLINKKVDNILFEFEDWAEDEAGFEVGSAQRFLNSCNYELFGMDGEKLSSIQTTGNAMIWAKPKI